MLGFYGVLVHGKIKWPNGAPFNGAPNGFFVWKHTAARDDRQATAKAFSQTKRHLKKYSWLEEAGGSLKLECDRICRVPFRKLLRLRHEGHAFYDD